MLNKATIIGNLGSDPEFRNTSNGSRMAQLSVATTEKWRDKGTGEAKSKTEWHRVSVFGDGLVSVIENYLKKGSKVYIEGKIQTSKFEKDGQTHYATQIVLQGFDSKLVMLDNRNSGEGAGAPSGGHNPDTSGDFDDDIPF